MWLIVCKIKELLAILAQPCQGTPYVHFTITCHGISTFLLSRLSVYQANPSLPDSVGRSILFSCTMRRSLNLYAILDLDTPGNSLPVSDIGVKTVGRKRNVSVETARFRGLTTLKFCDPRRGTVERGRRGWRKERRYGQRYRETRRAWGFFLFFLPTYGNRDKIGDGSRNR